ncbi:GvpL/GvpF family gas vesicle protein [Streptomyces sp. NBC_00624]|uniref:GvpL/GvpF family gas vesicle protein n=1 Tax=Streptomyces sp. NBC_00624 TaxID=2975791 RepID=UPI0030E4A4C8
MAVTGRVRAGIIDVHAHWLPRELLSLPPGLYETPPHPATQLVPLRPGMLTAGGTSTALMADGTVLPLQFGFTTTDDNAVRRVLEDRTEEFTERLRTLEGCVEYHLKAAQDEDALLRQILQESDEARGLNEEIRSGNGSPELPLALGELVSQEVQARQDQLAAGVLDALRRFARDERSSQATGNDFLSVSFLVERDNEKSFLSAEQDLAKELGEDFSLRLHGPLPAYSFV